MDVAVVSLPIVLDLIRDWAKSQKGRYICVANVHMCMESFDDPGFRDVVNRADLTVPDGLPLVWTQRWLGHGSAAQTRGEDLMDVICAMAETARVPIGLFGGTEEVLRQLKTSLQARFPRLEIPYTCSPPFRELTKAEDERHVHDINQSGIRILFVGLGCPKQERWMAAHRERLSAVMLGVGAAFDFISGSKRSAPRWMQVVGLEWLFRLLAEPTRLWKRYLRHNPRFVWHVSKQIRSRNDAKRG